MKNITSFINESIKDSNAQKTTVGDFLKVQTDDDWDKSTCEDWFDNGGFNTFNDVDEMYNFLNANKKTKINVVSTPTNYDYEISFKIKDKKITISFTEPFLNADDDENWTEKLNGKEITVGKFLKIASFNHWNKEFCDYWFDNGGDYVFDSEDEMYKFLNSNKNEKMVFKAIGFAGGEFTIKGKTIHLNYLQLTE